MYMGHICKIRSCKIYDVGLCLLSNYVIYTCQFVCNNPEITIDLFFCSFFTDCNGERQKVNEEDHYSGLNLFDHFVN